VIIFSIAKNKLKSINDITMRFSKNSFFKADRNFIYLDLFNPVSNKLLGTSVSAVSLNGKPIYNSTTLIPNESNSQQKLVNINFKRNITATDLKIKSLTAFIDNDQVVFTLTYSSQKDRFLLFFNPPKGNVLMYLDRIGINKSDTMVSFQIPKILFSSVKNISMRFSTIKDAENDRNFIFLEKSDTIVKNILGLPSSH